LISKAEVRPTFATNTFETHPFQNEGDLKQHRLAPSGEDSDLAFLPE
jgi:hypothetical protein